LNLQTTLFESGAFNFKLNHLIIIGVLVLAFSTSFLIRSQPAEYGNELNEFDPFFNFRATEYIVQNGFSEYFEWHDDKSWYPIGRDISATSQVMLHTTAAITYQLFAGNSSLYDFTILFPAIIGSLTVIVIFALVRLFAGTTAGLFASLLFAVSLPIILRGSIGWFKSEPLGIFYGLLGLYLFLSAIHSKNNKIVISKIIVGGITMGFGMSAWGGNQFFIIPLGLFILALPFFRNDHKFLLWSVPLFTIIFLLVSSSFERPGPSFVYGIGGLALIIPNIFLIISIFIQKISKDENKIRNSLFLLVSILLIGSLLLIINDESNNLPLPSFRYLNAINPFLTSNTAMVDSVAEHATPDVSTSFILHSILMIFAALGVWLLLSKKSSESKIFIKNDMKVFVLIFGITGVYVSSSFLRLEVFASISLVILASISLSMLSKNFFMINTYTKKSILFKILFVVIILILFITPMIFPSSLNWINGIDFPVVILNGATSNPPSSDWKESLQWIKTNTPENSVIASWWDYGYWIQTLGERATLSDNSTIHSNLIEDHASMFLSNPDEGWKMLQEMNADYIVTFISVQKIDAEWQGNQMYLLGGGGDESKVYWFANIAGLSPQIYLESSDISVKTNSFWNETLIGKMIPYTVVTYYDNQNKKESTSYLPGYNMDLSIKEIKYNIDDNGPLKLVYASPSFYDESIIMKNCVFIYEINKNYVSLNNP
jgi:dolichyl-diphosphooligosaccharide---protein glycosyltransferase